MKKRHLNDSWKALLGALFVSAICLALGGCDDSSMYHDYSSTTVQRQ